MELDRFIDRRVSERERANREHDLWAESVLRRYNERWQLKIRARWLAYHNHQAVVHDKQGCGALAQWPERWSQSPTGGCM